MSRDQEFDRNLCAANGARPCNAGAEEMVAKQGLLAAVQNRNLLIQIAQLIESCLDLREFSLHDCQLISPDSAQ
jgi:hypothetical protein